MNILKKIVLISIGMIIPIQSQSNINNLKKAFLEQEAINKTECNRTINHAFAHVDYLKKSNRSIMHYVKSIEIQKIFQENTESNQMDHAQLIMIAQLYELFFAQVVQQTNSLLLEIVTAKQYWKTFLCQRSSSNVLKYSSLLLYEATTKDSIKHRICLLESLEKQISELLGIGLYGNHHIQNIDSLSTITQNIQAAINPLDELMRFDIATNPSDYFKKISLFQESLQEKKGATKKLLQNHGVPYHIKRHVYFYTTLAIVGIAGSVFCHQHWQDMPHYQQKSYDAVKDFVQEFLVSPMKGLKQALWDRPELNLEKFDLKDMPSSILTCYTPERFGKYTGQTLLYDFNKLVDATAEIIKRQRINYYLSAIMPVVIGVYGIYRNGRYYYNHESYFKPMRILLHEIDVICNKTSTEQDKKPFNDFGMIYFCICQLQQYLNCLQDHEKIMMEQDLQELSSFDLSILQKQKTIERMYRTYGFLRNKF